MKKFLIVANWKLNGNIKMISDFFECFKVYSSNYFQKNTIVIAPPTVYLERVYQYINNKKILLGAQNIDIHVRGAFTGETSIAMLHDIGVKYVIIGHSERRLLHNETNEIIIKKFQLIKELNLIPILCIGETEEEKKYGKTHEVIQTQLGSILTVLGKSAFRNVVIAYEPLWSIGTGISANPEDVQLIHQFIKKYIENYDIISIKNIILQYGGSVNHTNAKKFIEQKDIDGLLIGNSSLYAEEFLKIIKIVNSFY